MGRREEGRVPFAGGRVSPFPVGQRATSPFPGTPGNSYPADRLVEDIVPRSPARRESSLMGKTL